MKKRVLSLLLVLAILGSFCVPTALAAAPGYGDVSGHWAEASISRWSEYGIVEGHDGSFRPDGDMTRAEAATVFARLLGLEEKAALTAFSDMQQPMWYDDAIAKCVAAGILNGAGDKMNPNGKITREMFFVMFARAMKIGEDAALEKPYTDAEQISDWAKGSVYALVNRGYVGGVAEGVLAGGREINRASVMALLDKTIEDYQVQDGKPTITLKGEKKPEQKPEQKPSGGGSVVPSGPTYRDLTIESAAAVGSADEETPQTYQNVTITDAVGNGEVTLRNLTIRGDLTIRGGGSNSIKLVNCTILGRIILDKDSTAENAQPPRLELTNTEVPTVVVEQPAILEATDGRSEVTAVEAKANTTVQGAATAIQKIEIPAAVETAPEITVSAGTVAQIDAKSEVTVGGSGSVAEVVAAAPVTVASETVAVVTVCTQAAVTVNGTSDIEVAVETTGKVEIVTTNGNVSVSTTLDEDVTVVTKESKDAAETSVAHIHKWNDGEVTVEPTCDTDGVKTYTCTVSGCTDPAATKTETIPATGHSFETAWSHDLNHHWHAAACSHTEVRAEDAPHTWNGSTCSVCGYTMNTYTFTLVWRGEGEHRHVVARGLEDNWVGGVPFSQQVTISSEAEQEDGWAGTMVFENCTFSQNVVITSRADAVFDVDFRGCSFLSGAKVVAAGTDRVDVHMVDCTNGVVESAEADCNVMVRSGSATLNGVTYTTTSVPQEENDAMCFLRVETRHDDADSNGVRQFSVAATGGYAASITGTATNDTPKLELCGNLDVSGYRAVKPMQIVSWDVSKSETFTLNLGANEAYVVDSGSYAITANDPSQVRVQADGAAVTVNGVRVDKTKTTPELSNLRFANENGAIMLKWDCNLEDVGMRYEVWLHEPAGRDRPDKWILHTVTEETSIRFASDVAADSIRVDAWQNHWDDDPADASLENPNLKNTPTIDDTMCGVTATFTRKNDDSYTVEMQNLPSDLIGVTLQIQRNNMETNFQWFTNGSTTLTETIPEYVEEIVEKGMYYLIGFKNDQTLNGNAVTGTAYPNLGSGYTYQAPETSSITNIRFVTGEDGIPLLEWDFERGRNVPLGVDYIQFDITAAGTDADGQQISNTFGNGNTASLLTFPQAGTYHSITVKASYWDENTQKNVQLATANVLDLTVKVTAGTRANNPASASFTSDGHGGYKVELTEIPAEYKTYQFYVGTAEDGKEGTYDRVADIGKWGDIFVGGWAVEQQGATYEIFGVKSYTLSEDGKTLSYTADRLCEPTLTGVTANGGSNSGTPAE